MVLVGEYQELSRYATKFGGVEGLHALGGQNAVIFFAVDAQNGRIPILNELMRGVGK